ncbi:MAG: deoxyribonuclease V [Candidatus Brocadiia bacterium]
MHVSKLHDWDVTTQEARELQEQLRGRVELRPLPSDIRLVAGADLAFSRKRDLVFAAVVVLQLPELKPVEQVGLHMPCPFPYVPGLLTFREGPAVAEAFRRIEHRPDAVIFDGHGYAHPRRIGLASHMGLWLGIPAVGCAKSRLVGEYEMPDTEKGERTPLTDDGEQIGVVLRSRTDVKPVFVSPGHMADFETSTELVLRCCPRYRLPEPTRQAHHAVAEVKKAHLADTDD